MQIKELRIRSGLTQVELADKLKIEQTAVSQWENGKTKPTADNLLQLSKIFNCSLDDLFRDAS